MPIMRLWQIYYRIILSRYALYVNKANTVFSPVYHRLNFYSLRNVHSETYTYA